jgi:hypothetical protein
MELPSIGTWQEMKVKLQEKYMPADYHMINWATCRGRNICRNLMSLRLEVKLWKTPPSLARSKTGMKVDKTRIASAASI